MKPKLSSILSVRTPRHRGFFPKAMAAPIGLAVMAMSPVGLAGNTWDGGGETGSWADPNNWDNNIAPSSGAALNFNGTLQLTNTNDLFSPGTSFSGLNFYTNAGQFIIGGNSIKLSGTIDVNTSAIPIIELDMELNATSFIRGNQITIDGVISGAHQLDVGVSDESGIVNLNGTNTFSALKITRGVAIVSSIGDHGSSGPVGIGTVDLGGGTQSSTLRYTGVGETNNRIFTLSSAVSNANGRIDHIGSGTLTLTGAITNSGANKDLTLEGSGLGVSSGAITDGDTTLDLFKTGVGTWTLSGANTYDGTTNVVDGTLAGIGTSAFGNTSNINITGGKSLSLRGDASTSFVKSSDSSAYSITTSGSGVTINVNQATVAGTTAKTMTIGNIGTTSTAATYQINFTGANNTGLNTGAVTGPASVLTSEALVTLSNANTSGTTTIASYTSANNPPSAGGERLRFIENGNTTVSGSITPSTTVLRLQKDGTGTLTLNGANTYTGTTTLNGGTLQFGKKASLYNGISGSWTAENILALTGTTLALNVGGTDEFTAADVNTLLANISVATTSTGLRSGATIGFDTTNAAGGTFTQGNVIANSTGTSGGAIGLTKLGGNTLVLDKANTYTGITTVTAGTLAINGDQSAATGNVSVSGTGSRLIGTGTVGGNTTINTGSIHSAGGQIANVDKVDLQTFDKSGGPTASLTFEAGSVFEWDLNANTDTSNGTRGTHYDAVDVTGTLAVNANAIFRVVLGSNVGVSAGTFWEQDRTWTNIFGGGYSPSGGFSLIQVVDATTGSNFDQNILHPGYTFSVSGTTLRWSAIPEPSSALAGLLIGAGLLRRRRSVNSLRR